MFQVIPFHHFIQDKVKRIELSHMLFKRLSAFAVYAVVHTIVIATCLSRNSLVLVGTQARIVQTDGRQL